MVAFNGSKPILKYGASGWIASSPPNHRFRFAVIGTSEREARIKYIEAERAWNRLGARIDAERDELRQLRDAG